MRRGTAVCPTARTGNFLYGSLDDVVDGIRADHEKGDDEGAPTSGRPDIVRDDD